MTEHLKEREMLIIDLNHEFDIAEFKAREVPILKGHPDYVSQKSILISHFVDFILSDRKRIVEPLVKCESEILSNQSDKDNLWVANEERKKSIDKVLKLSGIEQ